MSASNYSALIAGLAGQNPQLAQAFTSYLNEHSIQTHTTDKHMIGKTGVEIHSTPVESKTSTSATTLPWNPFTGPQTNSSEKRPRGRPKKILTEEQLQLQLEQQKQKEQLIADRQLRTATLAKEKLERQQTRDLRTTQKLLDQETAEKIKSQRDAIRQQNKEKKLREAKEKQDIIHANRLAIYMKKKTELEEYARKYGPFE
jgi:hypothetical protein